VENGGLKGLKNPKTKNAEKFSINLITPQIQFLACASENQCKYGYICVSGLCQDNIDYSPWREIEFNRLRNSMCAMWLKL
jgi:hypothetical protein